ncbi:MAG: type II secretion system protein [Culicoidibacterales bacterium]
MNQHKQAGFTLTEMMVVIAIVGILLIVVIPNAVNVLDSAKTQGCDAYLNTKDKKDNLFPKKINLIKSNNNTIN